MADIDTGTVIRELRAEVGYTQADFAVELNISRSALTQLEAGKTKPGYDVLKLLFTKFSLTPEEIFGINGEEQLVSEEKQIVHNVKNVTEFWLTQYQENYSPPAEDIMVSKFMRIATNPEGVEALIKLLSSYRKVLRFTDLFEMDFLDPLKRMNTILKRYQENSVKGRIDQDLEVQYNNLFLKVQKLLEKAILLNQEKEIQYFEQLPEDFCRRFNGVSKDMLPSLKMFKYTQEKYLRAFFYLLETGDVLEDVAAYYESEDFFDL